MATLEDGVVALAQAVGADIKAIKNTAPSITALNGVTGLWIGTQAQYDAIATKVSTVVYVVR